MCSCYTFFQKCLTAVCSLGLLVQYRLMEWGGGRSERLVFPFTACPPERLSLIPGKTNVLHKNKPVPIQQRQTGILTALHDDVAKQNLSTRME